MSKIIWGKPGEKRWETGVDHGVHYRRNADGDYDLGVPWNGLTNVTQSPSGAESNKQYADNGVYANLKSAEEFGGTIEAWMYPKQFGPCIGLKEVVPGVYVAQQTRETFGFFYRTIIGNDLTSEAGHTWHLIWGADAAPSEESNATVNDSPELKGFSYEVTTSPVEIGTVDGEEYKATSHMWFDTTETDADFLAALGDILFGTDGVDPRLPSPREVIELATSVGGPTVVNLAGANAPSYNAATHVVTVPAVTGVTWQINGEDVANGEQPALTVGQSALVEPKPNPGVQLTGDDDWYYEY